MIIYTTQGKGLHPIHGAYWDGDVWHGQAWMINGRFSPEYRCSLDIVAPLEPQELELESA